MPPDSSFFFLKITLLLREVLMGNDRKGLRAIGDRFGISSRKHSLSELISRHRFGDWEKRDFGEISRRWNGPGQEYRIMALNAGLTHFDVVPRARLERYGGPGFVAGVRAALIEIIASGDYAAEISGASVTPFVGPALVKGIMDEIASKVDEALDTTVTSYDGKDPARMLQQALAIRQMLDEGGFDLGLLCEVWHGAEYGQLVGANAPFHPWTGGAGLLALPLSDTCPIVHAEFRAFANRGDGQRDIDFYSDKGAQLARVRTPAGVVDFYQTHLHNGGDMGGILDAAGEYKDQFAAALILNGVVIRDPTPADRAAVRKAQLEELARFVEETRLPDSLVVIAGDFNVDGCSAHAEGPVPPDCEGALYGSFADVKALRDRLGLEDAAVRFGLDGVGTMSGDACPRLDYFLVEKPKQAQGVVVDLLEMDVPWLTDAVGALTDHKALAISIRCSQPK